MYSAQTETKSSEQLACIILAAQVLNLGLWHARPHLRHQCGHNAPATRYDISSSWLSESKRILQKKNPQKSHCHHMLSEFHDLRTNDKSNILCKQFLPFW